MVSTFRCKRCGSLEVRNSRSRNFLEKYVLRLMLLRPVRCRRCHQRDYRLLFQKIEGDDTGGMDDNAAA